MSPRLRALVGSLEFRLWVPLALTVGLVLAIHAMLGFSTTRDRFAELLRHDLERSSRLIENATHDAMLLNRLDEAQAMLERLGTAPEFPAIRVLDKHGRIVLSSDRAELDRTLGIESPSCVACHPAGRVQGEGVLPHRTMLVGEGADTRRRLTVIDNEPGCATAACHVHPQDRPVLGVLDVEMSMAPFDAEISRARTRLAWTTGVLILVSGLVAALFVRRLVHLPVARLREGTSRIARGDLDTSIDVPGDHELAALARSFNAMAGDLRRARAENDAWAHTLQDRVDAKTRELERAQARMLQAETMSSLGKLSATVAHELNNPLGGILAYARLVRRELAEHPLDDAVRAELEEYLTLIDQECTRCSGIVRNLLAFARRREARAAPADLRAVVGRCLMLVRHHLEMHAIGLETDLGGDDLTATVDADQIEQALLALLMNAIEAMASAGGGPHTLRVNAAGVPSEVRFKVSDTGIGIDPAAVPHIYEPFFSTKTGESGVGLGLAVVFGVVHGHGGTIEVTSAPGRGTTFTVVIPRTPPEAEGDEQA